VHHGTLRSYFTNLFGLLVSSSTPILDDKIFSMNRASSPPSDDPLPPIAEDSDAEPGADAVVVPSTLESRKRTKHVELLEDVLRSLDALVYIELSALYYLDCAFGLFILRTLVQLFLLSARPPGLPSPRTRSALGALVGSNLFCILLHLVNPRPEAGEASHFYLHGSILIDFVGQLGPTSKWRLLGMDVLVLGLQVIMLALGIEKRKVRNAEKRTRGSGQDLESEEAGIIHSEEVRSESYESNAGIEMQDLLADPSREDEVGQAGSNVHELDEFYNGNFNLARLNVVETIARDVSANTTAADPAAGGVSLPGLLLRWRSLR
jgi:Fungal domain of unknown function (DUF1746)